MSFSLHTSIPHRGVTVVTQTRCPGLTITAVLAGIGPTNLATPIGRPPRVLHAWRHEPAWVELMTGHPDDHMGVHQLVERKVVSGALPCSTEAGADTARPEAIS